jgi:hypothetical protein
MKRLVLSLGFLVALGVAWAQGEGFAGSLEIQGDYAPPNHEAVDASGLVPIAYGSMGGLGLRKVGSDIGDFEAKAILALEKVVPAFVGEGPLTRGNNLALALSGEFSPVSLNANFRASLTPVAFLKLTAGAGLGTGWDIGFVGLGINDPVNGIVPQNFGGLVYRAWLEGTFQFDVAALFPGEWNHVVVLASPKIQYQGYTGAGADQAWIWEADKGLNFNGLKLTGSYLLGYQMPLALDLAGVLLQTEGWLGRVRDMAPMGGGTGHDWGSDFTYLTFGPLLDFRLGERSSLAVLPQFKKGIKWSDPTSMIRYFGNRDYEASYLYFYRLAFDYTLKL